jgi:hypothetical protein
MLGLFFFGPRLERQLGGKDFLFLYFLPVRVTGSHIGATQRGQQQDTDEGKPKASIQISHF